MTFLQVTVLVPFVTVRDLHEPHAAFGISSSHQALDSKILGFRIVHTVHVQCFGRFVGDVLNLWRFVLHTKR